MFNVRVYCSSSSFSAHSITLILGDSLMDDGLRGFFSEWWNHGEMTITFEWGEQIITIVLRDGGSVSTVAENPVIGESKYLEKGFFRHHADV